jgi:hypothetical protein
MGFGLVIGFIGHLQNVTTNNYDSLTELHIPKMSTYEVFMKSVFTSRFLVAVFNLGRSPSSALGTVPGLLYQLLTSRN